MEKSKAAKALDMLRSLIGVELATEIKLTDYEAKDGSKISTDEDGKVQGDVADGEYELADGSTLLVKDGVASKKEVKEETEKAADDEESKSEGEVEDNSDKKEGESDDALKSSIDALTAAIQQLISGMGLKEQELKDTQTKLAEAEKKVELADKQPIDKKPGIGQGLTTLNDDTKMTKAQRALAHARANKG
jgi:hypothetical protein